MAFDDKFIKRVYRTSLWVTAVCVVWALGLRQPLAALGLVLGSAVGIAALRSLEWVVKRTITAAPEHGGGFPLAKYVLLKYPAYLLVMVPVVLTKNVPLIVGFVAGLGLLHTVIILKAVGQMVLRRMEGQKEV